MLLDQGLTFTIQVRYVPEEEDTSEDQRYKGHDEDTLWCHALSAAALLRAGCLRTGGLKRARACRAVSQPAEEGRGHPKPGHEELRWTSGCGMESETRLGQDPAGTVLGRVLPE